MESPPSSSPVMRVTPSSPDASATPPVITPRPTPTPILPSPPPSRLPSLTSPPPSGSSPPPPDDPFSPPPPVYAASAESPPSPLSLYPPWPLQSTSGKSSSPSTAFGVGVAVGGVVLLGLAAVLIFCLVSKRRRRRRLLLPGTAGPPPTLPTMLVSPSPPDTGATPHLRRPPPSSPPPPAPLSLYPPPPPPQSWDGPSTSARSKAGSSGTSVGVGVAIGAVVLLGLAALLIFCLVSKRSHRRRKLLPGIPADFDNPRQGTTPLQLSQVLSATPLSTPKIDPYGMPNCIQKLKTLGLRPIEQYKVINHLKEDLLNRQAFVEVEADVLDEIIKVVVQAQV